jgi:D-glycero-alpha-D-manno-heptose-7-phosphate kinase
MPSRAFTVRLLDHTGHSATAPIIRAKSPLRVSFAGGGTDFPDYYNKYGGMVFSSTINRYAHATVQPRADEEIVIRSLDLGHMVQYNACERPIFDGILDLAKAAVLRIGIRSGVDIRVRTDAPPGSGLGGSSAMTSALIGALCALHGDSLGPYELAELNWTIERVDVKIAGGKQDQYETTFGGLTLTEFYADRVVVNPLRIDQDILNDLEAHLLLCYTGQVRTDLGLIDQHLELYRAGRLATVEGMHRLRLLASQMKDALLGGRLDAFGAMLDESYQTKKRINPSIVDGTSAEVLYDAARRQGALGGKLLGAGGGGYLLLYCPTDRILEVRRELTSLGGQFTDFAFDGLGLQVWRSKCL